MAEALSIDRNICTLGFVNQGVILKDSADASDASCVPKYVLKMTTKIGKKSSDEPLLLYFSNDGGASFYNADDPRVATRVATDDEIHSRRVQDCITNEASCIPDGEECGSSCDDHLIQKVGDCCSGVSHFAFVSCSSLMCLLSLEHRLWIL